VLDGRGQSKLARPRSVLITSSIPPMLENLIMGGREDAQQHLRRSPRPARRKQGLVFGGIGFSAGRFNPRAARSVRPSSQMPLLPSSPRMGLV